MKTRIAFYCMALLGGMLAGPLLPPAICQEAGTTPAPPAPFDLADVSGTWKPLSGQLNGFDLPGSQLDSIVLTITRDRFRTEGTGFRESGQLLVPRPGTGQPQSIDVMIETGPNAGKTVEGIIRMEEDVMVVCYATRGDRPSRFVSTRENEYLLLKYQKQEEQ